MKIIVTKDYEKMSLKAFEVLKGVVKSKPYAVLGLATGTTPLGLYHNMIEDHKTHGTSYAHIRAVNLDEYQGLPKDHPQSYAYFMRGIISYSRNYRAIYSSWAWGATGTSHSTSRIRRLETKRTSLI